MTDQTGEGSRQSPKLVRRIGSWGMLMTGLTGIIGSGWLFASLYAVQIAGPAAILSWIIGCILALALAIIYAELGAMIPEAGALARVPHVALGPLGGFVRKSAAETDNATGRELSVPALEAGQKQWSLYRDQHCEFVGTTFGGGSGTGIGILDCRIELTRARERELMQFVQ